MRLEDPKGALVSIEMQFADEITCLKAAQEYGKDHPGEEMYPIEASYGFSFTDSDDKRLEHRFACYLKPVATKVNYYEARAYGSRVRNLDGLRKLYYALTKRQEDYKPVDYPDYDGGYNQYNQPTARCITKASDETIVGLIINPPFPNGHPIRKYKKPKKKHTAKHYLPVLLGMAVGFAARPVMKKLNKLFGHLH